MCSRAPIRPAAALGLALTLALAIACGHKEDPKPPPQKLPAPVTDLQVVQRGSDLLLEFTYPQTTISGLPIEEIVAVELWEHQVAVPEFRTEAPAEDDEPEAAEGEDEGDESAPAAESGETDPTEDETDETPVDEPPAPEEPAAEAGGETEDGEDEDESESESESEGEGEGEDTDEAPTAQVLASGVGKETLLEVDPFEFLAASTLRLKLEGQELSDAIRGDKMRLRRTLDKIEPGEKLALVFAVKTFQTLNRASAFSNLVKIIPRPTPDPPTDLKLEPVSNGVKISWTFEGDEPLEFRFYRRDPLSAAFGGHFGVKVPDSESDQFLDSSAEFGKSYVYAMSVVINRTPVVESNISAEHEIAYSDVFPPEAPTDLVVLAEVGAARLLWEASSDRDVAGYVVYRRTGGGEFVRLNERPLRAAEYNDTSASSGRVYAYRVVAVDREGNMSEPSLEVEVRIP